jgi:hypothetical protein
MNQIEQVRELFMQGMDSKLGRNLEYI